MREETNTRENGHLQGIAKQPPAWNQNQRLLEWPECTLDLSCTCGFSSGYPCKLLAARHGNRTFADLLPRLKCRVCRSAPAEIFLVAGHQRQLRPGPNPD